MIDLPLKFYKEGEFEAANSGGVEREVGELLYAFVRILKPERVLETGTHKGISSAYMGLGLKENNKGTLCTIEFDNQHYQEARTLWQNLGVRDYIELFEGRVEEFKPQGQYDMFFLDTEVNIRLHEMVRLFPFLREGGYAIIHDMPFGLCQNNINPDHPEFKHWPIGEIPQELINLVKDDKLRPTFFPNPRGMMMFYKPRMEEYKW